MVEIINVEYVKEHEEDILTNSRGIIPFPIRRLMGLESFVEFVEDKKEENDNFTEVYHRYLEYKNIFIDKSLKKGTRDSAKFDVRTLKEFISGNPQFSKVLIEDNIDEYIKNRGNLKRYKDLKRVERKFHQVIYGRAPYLKKDFPDYKLPTLREEMEFRWANYTRNIWFPVPKMFGGFSYTITYKDDHYELMTDSWCRVCGGSGQTHRITAKSAELIDEGFV